MDKEILEILHTIVERIEKLPTEDRVREMIDERILRTEIFIENTVTKRIDSLFDGYKLTHEKQYELERRVEKLEQVIAELQSKIA